MSDDKQEQWTIKNESNVSFQLDESHEFCIERTLNGFVFKVFDNRGYEHKLGEPIILYYGKISDLQLGFTKVIEK